MDSRKRERPGAVQNANGGFKKSKQEMDSSGIGSKSKPCTKFFSMSGCPFGQNCHFLHYVPGGYNVVSQMMNLGPTLAQRPIAGPPIPNGTTTTAPSSIKTRMCNKYSTAEGCRFGDKCNFAHGEWELGKPIIVPENPHPTSHYPPPRVEPPPATAPASFGASATAKISVDSNLAGPIIGKAGVNSKQICRLTGVKLSIRDHESDLNLKNIELEGTFDQIKEASVMVTQLIASIGSSAAAHPAKSAGPGPGPRGPHQASNYKTKLCENFAKGTCTFGDRCHFAHGANELQKSAV